MCVYGVRSRSKWPRLHGADCRVIQYTTVTTRIYVAFSQTLRRSRAVGREHGECVESFVAVQTTYFKTQVLPYMVLYIYTECLLRGKAYNVLRFHRHIIPTCKIKNPRLVLDELAKHTRGIYGFWIFLPSLEVTFPEMASSTCYLVHHARCVPGSGRI